MNDCWKDFIFNLNENVADRAAIESSTSWSPVRGASDWPIEASCIQSILKLIQSILRFWSLCPPPASIKGMGAYCFLNGSRWRLCWRKTFCPLSNLNILWNILLILGTNVDQDKMTCQIQDWQLWLSYLWSYLILFYLKKNSCPLCNSNTFWNISMVLGRNVEQDEMTCLVQEWQPCLSYFWHYLPLL